MAQRRRSGSPVVFVEEGKCEEEEDEKWPTGRRIGVKRLWGGHAVDDDDDRDGDDDDDHDHDDDGDDDDGNGGDDYGDDGGGDGDNDGDNDDDGADDMMMVLMAMMMAMAMTRCLLSRIVAARWARRAAGIGMSCRPGKVDEGLGQAGGCRRDGHWEQACARDAGTSISSEQ